MKLCSILLLVTLGATSAQQRGLRRSSSTDNNMNPLNVDGASSQTRMLMDEKDTITGPPPPFEPAPNSCVPFDQAYTSASDFQGEFGNGDFASGIAEFEATCGFGGSCFAGAAEGCCRVTYMDSIECDLNRLFPAAACVCNEHTDIPRSQLQPGNDTVTIDTPTVSPAPSVAPTPLSENCQVYNATSPLYQQPNFWLPPLTAIAAQNGMEVNECSGDEQCASGNCCLRSLCVCHDFDLSHLPFTVECTGDSPFA
mmetsp:Transcript_14681/g.23110  ORF Transcript_14681/g.23110 Transcript_14681/m.23110 type:complete len:254 (-) Transcript_14681:377-1138(-)|eukprot:CAMPEP_0117019442 /NCGR_PEP_ID=MMETSP0472-20121206/14924_1 /TAXON_ID=693140 ORGANISM="Tiarina fusus, Strain LIS" /NCGR_SAMPLE_ID=MMETSP0472 /ASSEMBLY_ACC=CAM_ASM_000603 /LENGTH=253 /DNA_ID=CAMNT_0004724419 /DNA_START=110 /DNA_END=871 /DNA_ORIENTATION=-